jgi:hypothetical protein
MVDKMEGEEDVSPITLVSSVTVSFHKRFATMDKL